MLCAEEESSSEEMVGQEPEEASGRSSGAEGSSPTSGHYTGPSAGCTAVSATSPPDPGDLPQAVHEAVCPPESCCKSALHIAQYVCVLVCWHAGAWAWYGLYMHVPQDCTLPCQEVAQVRDSNVWAGNAGYSGVGLDSAESPSWQSMPPNCIRRAQGLAIDASASDVCCKCRWWRW